MATHDQLTQIGAPLPITSPAGPPLDARAFAALHGISKVLQMVIENTHQLFGGDVCVVLEEDPELPDEVNIVFNITTHGAVDDVLAKEDEWHARCVQLAESASVLFRLHVDVL